MEHEPGCAYWRQRPCNCEYLISWRPDEESIYAFPTSWITAPRGGIKYGQTPRRGTVALTPQLRDQIRRSCLSMALEAYPVPDTDVITIDYTLDPRKSREELSARLSRDLRSVRALGGMVLPGDLQRLIEERDYYRATSWFYRKISVLFGLTTLASILVNVGFIVRWW